MRWYQVAKDGTLLDEQLRADDYDPRLRPWYQAAAETAAVCWTGPYVMRTTREPGISASLRLTAAGQANPVVAGADILLSDLNRILAQALPSPEARAYLRTGNGQVLAASDDMAFQRVLADGPPELPRATEPRFQPLGALWEQRATGAAGPLDISTGEGAYRAAFAPIALTGRDEPFVLAVLLPSASLFAEFRQESTETALLFLGFLVLSAGLFARRFLVPIRRLTRVAERLDAFGEAPPPPRPRRDEVGALEGAFHGTWQRQTEQRRALEASDQRYRQLFEEAPILYGITRDVDGVPVIDDCNRAFHEALDLAKEAVVGRPLTEFYSPASRHELETVGYRAALEGRFTEAERTLVRADGSELHTLVRAVPDGVPGGGGTTGIRAAYVDVTALHRAEQERTRLADELRQAQKMESVGRLAGGVAHDFNNLLQVINGRCELLCDPPPADPQLAQNLAEIRAAGRRAADLTRQLLAFGRKQVLTPRPVTLNEVVEPMLPLPQRLLPEDVKLDARFGPDPWKTTADPGQLGQVLMNLILNARDALPEGGHVRVSTENRRCAAPTGGAVGEWVVLQIQDSGTGMPPEVLARVFEPFYTTKGLGRGTGLGLAVVQGIVEQSGGRVQVHSQPGAGTTFEVLMPRRTAEEPPARAAEALADPPQAPQEATLLLVEDEAPVAEVLRQILSGAGYRILDAASEADALRVAAAHRGAIELLVSDVVMPGGSGPSLARRLREAQPNLRVLFISGYPGEEMARRGVDTGSSGFLQKPFTRAALLTRVREVLGTYREL